MFVCERTKLAVEFIPGFRAGPCPVALRLPLGVAPRSRFLKLVHVLGRDHVCSGSPMARDDDWLTLRLIKKLAESVLRLNGRDGDHDS